MKTLCTLFFLFVFAVNAAQISRRTCRTRTGEILRENEEWKDPHYCSIYRCSVYDGEPELDGLTCATFRVPPGCQKVDGRGYYPDCCPTVVCHE
uniref:Putative La1-like peptide n=1 Tax=Megacormus gertschi TaxID=1843536 RepID=A0A224X3M2_9SCOR